MLREIMEEIVEATGPVIIKALAVVAGFIIFLPLLAALIAPVFS